MLVIGGLGSGKRNALLNLINQKLYTYKIYLNAKDLYEAKYPFELTNAKLQA